MDDCVYCGQQLILQPRYQVRESIKPKGHPYRWRVIGVCCEDCQELGKPTTIERIQ